LVKFKKLLGKRKITIPVDPIEIFSNLDKEVGKESLRDPQEAVLKEWYKEHQTQKDIIVKLHTGQGKTLIGLLILQSSINEGGGPALYICPNNYLVDQIVEQARSFGIKTIKFTEKIKRPPRSFLNSEVILVANCQKLFNGRSQFGVRGTRRDVLNIGAIVIDDAHKCLDIIREQFSIKIKRTNGDGSNPIYERLWSLFEESLKRQAPGTCTDISNGVHCLMAVPFWTWLNESEEVLKILSEYKESDELTFVWDLLKDHINECICIFSGDRLEITPRLLPIDRIPSFSEAKRRIFLSATLTDDAFLVKDMGIEPESVINPLSTGDVKYSGERLILLPTLVDINFQRMEVISWVQALAAKYGTFGVVAITPSFRRADSWRSGGADITRVGERELYNSIDDLKLKVDRNEANNVLVLVNQYDGIDLPDSTCRILVLDLLPSYSTLMDGYLKETRPFSGIIHRQQAQKVEQGMGRAIRGSSDWCIVIIVGNNITNFLSEKSKRAYLSNEAQLQIKIGEELAEEMKIEGGQITDIEDLIIQCLRRDEGWKEYYRDRMSELEPDEPKKVHLDRATTERNAEIFCLQGQYKMAADAIQTIVDLADPSDKGWYLQLMATYLYNIDQTRSMDIQLKAHSENPSLFRPPIGITYSKLTSTGTRESRIFDWIKEHDSYNAAIIEITRIMGNLLWGSPSNTFEQGIEDLGRTLGFISDRPEKRTGEGPDNLWNIQGKLYWLIECKNQIKTSREEISKSEGGQLSNSIAWFKTYHESDTTYPVIIHPAEKLADGVYITDAFWVMGLEELKKLRENTESFYKSFTGTAFDSLSREIIGQKLIDYRLDTENLVREYLRRGKRA